MYNIEKKEMSKIYKNTNNEYIDFNNVDSDVLSVAQDDQNNVTDINDLRNI